MTIPSAFLQRVSVGGPLWQAEVEVLRLTNPQTDWAFRSLFLSQSPQTAGEPVAPYLPGTMILLAAAHTVTIALSGDDTGDHKTYHWHRRSEVATAPFSQAELRARLNRGDFALLLVQANPEEWPDPAELMESIGRGNDRRSDSAFFPALTCIAGEIALDSLEPQDAATAKFYQALTLTPPENSQMRQGPAHLISTLAVHSSGVSILGQIALPWETDHRLEAPFQLTATFPPAVSEERGEAALYTPLRLTLETERFTPDETQAWITSWRHFSGYLTPSNPLNGPLAAEVPTSPHWVTLEVTNPTAVPDLYWEITKFADAQTLDLQLKFGGGSLSLVLSNQSPFDTDNPPTSLARVIPDEVEVDKEDAETSPALRIRLNPKASFEQVNFTYRYANHGAIEPAERLESIDLENLTLAFNPVEVPRFLREQQGLPLPQLTASDGEAVERVDPPVLWGFMPLEQGWFQLPVPNLSEQIYFDTGFANPPPSTDEGELANPLIQGSVALGNDNATLLATDYPHEQPWNLVLTSARFQGTWTLTPTDSGYRLSAIELQGFDVELILNGLFWLSTARPRSQDALPDFENWVAGVRAFPLRTVRDTDLFPSVIQLQLPQLTLFARQLPVAAGAEPKPITAELGSWSFQYSVNAALFRQMVTATDQDDSVTSPVLPADTFSRFLPWVWQHHPRLPMIQALPLTQTQNPPSFPSASRQLVPFELPVANRENGLAIPDSWQFVAPSAGAWPQPAASLTAAREWSREFDLPLVSLSLPGWLLSARGEATGLLADSGLGLASQYRFDLPYTDEVNALAQLPELPQAPEALSPLPASPLPEPPQPLLRDTFTDHWQQLSEQASLASADAVQAFAPGPDASPQMVSLIEPFIWPVEVGLDLDSFPGRLTIANRDGANGTSLQLADDGPLQLSGVAALAGISGQFTQNGTEFTLVAGSLSAQPLTADSVQGFRDQRGLIRSASRVVNADAVAAETSSLIKTPVAFQAAPGTLERYELITTAAPASLKIGSQTWQFWCCDVPISAPENGTSTAFSRARSQSVAAEDVNDPAALSREYNFLNGYEWRLGDQNRPDGKAPKDYLSCFNLHFYPLTLEAVELAGDEVVAIAIMGRLQLPLAATGTEITSLRSEVLLRFTRQGGEFAIAAVEMVSSGEQASPPAAINTWPLAPEQNVATGVPQLTWSTIRLAAPEDSADGLAALIIDDVFLEFFLFGEPWSLQLPALRLPAAGPAPAGSLADSGDDIEVIFTFPSADRPKALVPRRARLRLDLSGQTFTHAADLFIKVSLGQLPESSNEGRSSPAGAAPTFTAEIQYALVASSVVISHDAAHDPPSLFKDLELNPISLEAHPHALQFHWQGYQSASPVQFWPGMPLQADKADGFAALTFASLAEETADPAPQPRQSRYPTLQLKTAFLETILSCRWGRFLQTSAPSSSGDAASPPPVSALDPEQLFGSSAGDAVIGYTTQWLPQTSARPAQWQESFLLNGFIEVKNVVSWPTDLTTQADADATTLILPALPPLTENGIRFLSHWRHTMRILFNQHRLPVKVLAWAAAPNRLFQFRRDCSWQVLAVTEHQLVEIQAPETDASYYSRGRERRWTTVQEVRLLPVPAFKALIAQSTTPTVDSMTGTATIGQTSLGYWNQALQQVITSADAVLDEAVLADTLIIEASASHWVHTAPVATESATTLQFLPNGSQLGILSTPADFGPSDPTEPRWLLLNMPFLGRLQYDPDSRTSTNPLQRDPVELLTNDALSGEAAPVRSLALALTSWGDTGSIAIALSPFDTATGRTWGRLDPLSLEESWFRLQHPLPEATSDTLQSILAALPSSVARLSRSVALRYAFTPQRFNYPPGGRSDRTAPPPLAPQVPATWRQQNLLIQDEPVRPARPQVLYTFYQDPDHPTRVRDVSGIGEAIDLEIDQPGQVEWLSSQGLRIIGPDSDNTPGTIIAATQSSTRLVAACRATHEITIEAWIRPAPDAANPNQVILQPGPGQFGPGRIVTLSKDTSNRFFTLGQKFPESRDDDEPSYFVGRLRTSITEENGTEYEADGIPDGAPGPTVRTGPGNPPRPEILPVIYTRRRDGLAQLHSLDAEGNVVTVSVTDPTDEPGTFENWHLRGDYNLALANEFYARNDPHSDRSWQGDYHLIAIYNVALTAAEVRQLMTGGLAARLQQVQPPPYSWHSTAVHLQTSGLLPPGRPAPAALSRYAAGTLIPATLKLNGVDNPLPASLAVSPYLGLEFQPLAVDSAATLPTRLASVELLCLDAAANALRPVASRLWEANLRQLDELSQIWARETHRRLAPESALAVLRFREIKDSSGAVLETAAPPLVVAYRFQMVTDLQPPETLARRTFSLRSQPRQLRFREGQFGGCWLPDNPQTFELAPPQATGVQPLYLPERPPSAAAPLEWPWGLNGLRLSVRYGAKAQPAIGSHTAESCLWWQAPSYVLQYRDAISSPLEPGASAGENLPPVAGLPPAFRPGAISSLLPVLPTPPLPHFGPAQAGLHPSSETWQPVLPGQLRYLLTGDRAGAMLAVRNQLFKQSAGAEPDPVLVSGSVPVQHRVPRPVPLPDTTREQTRRALQTWGSYFEPSHNGLVSRTPLDEAFFAEFAQTLDAGLRLQIPAHGLRVQLKTPSQGKISPAWDGEIVLLATSFVGSRAPNSWQLQRWQLQVQLVEGPNLFNFGELEIPVAPSQERPDIQSLPEQKYSLSVVDQERLQAVLLELASGDPVRILVQVQAQFALTRKVNGQEQTLTRNSGFTQTLTLPLRIQDSEALPLPLAPRFIHFEDPEYNRQLASNAAKATVLVLEAQGDEQVSQEITLASDRQEYNPDSPVFLRYDWLDNRDGDRATLKVERINSAGIVTPLQWPSPNQGDIISRQLQQVSLDLLQIENDVRFIQGDTLKFTLTVKYSSPGRGATEADLPLALTIVAVPVIPATQAAYGLLRTGSNAAQGAASAVQCVRFAYGPLPSRIELVCSDDLRNEIVRRRAVFSWVDAVRPASLQASASAMSQHHYGIQKITHNGSTHLPQFEAPIL